MARQFAAPFRHVKRERFRSESIPNNEYLPDARSRWGMRRTNILAVHRARDCKRPMCTNHIRGTE